MSTQIIVVAPGDKLTIYRQREMALTEQYDLDELIATHWRCRTQPMQDTGYCATVDSLRKVLTSKLGEIDQLKDRLYQANELLKMVTLVLDAGKDESL